MSVACVLLLLGAIIDVVATWRLCLAARRLRRERERAAWIAQIRRWPSP